MSMEFELRSNVLKLSKYLFTNGGLKCVLSTYSSDNVA